jgi:hypothetical protein
MMMYLSAGWANVFGPLLEFELLDYSTDGSTITGSILSGDTSLLGSFCHKMKLIFITINK